MLIVTGGAGFIGSNIVAALEERGETDIVVVDRLRDGIKWKNIAKRNLRDIVHPDDLPAFLEKHSGDVDTIFHMGAISATTETDADKILNNNLKLTTWLWEWCSRHSARLIYASSAATYGDGKQGFDDSFDEGDLAKLAPLNAYGWSKHATDRRFRRILDQNGFRPKQWAGLKFFNVYGPNEYHKGGMRSVVSQMFDKLSAGETATLFKSHHPDYEDGGQLRDFVWVGDVVNIIMWLYDNPQVSDLFNIGTGKARSFKDLALAVFSAMGKEPVINYVPTPEAIRDKYQYFTEANMAKLRNAGYDRDMTSLEEGVRTYIQDYLATEDVFR
ncbi:MULTISPECIES: ADP-glyceromanno-heptose 6-epimerase [Thalassospira]|jgi:ADP-L-glycero-D-manno-heptose 6-epimerase|uniref:ADP-L-glycero-D-manno-heptose-6-epimerase n=2 Tax=Thalassospira TaxID=168934 RepID=A0A367WC00_9PROT|nr:MULTISPECIES: ADP-glyceromanno-heptose 6-epimerase [Thalassospira]MDG4717751.1 ADP-glyceromanno-heptose 6-epimerase [Thalassospira sp. FZY0004]RCK38789.1 ADP-L-glycero-D-manno-heptose-6-epimerase [Thalassospira profundimaris]